MIRRALRLNRFQRAELMTMSDEEVRGLVAPVTDALKGPNATNFRVRYIEQVLPARNSVKLNCETKVDFEMS